MGKIESKKETESPNNKCENSLQLTNNKSSYEYLNLSEDTEAKGKVALNNFLKLTKEDTLD